jgi:hypothetical protein
MSATLGRMMDGTVDLGQLYHSTDLTLITWSGGFINVLQGICCNSVWCKEFGHQTSSVVQWELSDTTRTILPALEAGR